MQLYAFGKQSNNQPDVLALVNGYKTYPADATILRIHSACFTGDVLGSEKCDCGPQLEMCLDMISRAPWGVLLYFLQHEGRGIGLLTKIRAYKLQEEGFDTASANRELHAPIDSRDYDIGFDALRFLGVDRVWLLTNNPDKTEAVSRRITVEGVQRVSLSPTLFNQAYLRDKRVLFSHSLAANFTFDD